ncbi:hypothetical protein [Streptomyces sp. NPDC049949]
MHFAADPFGSSTPSAIAPVPLTDGMLEGRLSELPVDTEAAA